jgi:O-antigen/teichoic acid export membrane protein
MSNNTRIAKNTLFLYFRMILLMGLSLYTSRITLKVLGTDDFGIYNVVGGIVVLFMFFNSALTSGVQRYLNYYIGKQDEDSLNKIFSQSFFAFIILSIIIFILSETLGLLLLEKYMVIPPERMTAARIIYQLSIISTILGIIRIPFNAVIIAYEKMSFYAYTSILEGILKLVIIFILQAVAFDKLVLYASLTVVVSIILLVVYYIYCRLKFNIINFKIYKDKSLLKEILAFSGWNIIGSAASVLCNQGINIFINRFFGVAVNAAMGIANTANNAIYSFLSNFQTAFNPQIVKSYAQNDKEYLWDLIFKTSKYSFFLLYFIILPFLVNIDFILALWLADVPHYANIFILWLCIFTLIDSLSGSLWMLVEAEGNIKTYQIVVGVSGLAVIPLTYIAFRLNLPSYSGLIIHDIQLICFFIWRLFYLQKWMKFPVRNYLKKVIIPVIIIIIISVPCVYYIHSLLTGLLQFLISCISSIVIVGLLYIFIGTSKDERINLKTILLSHLLHKNRVENQ